MDILNTATSVLNTALDVADRLKANIEVTYRHAVPGRRPAFLFSNTGDHEASNLVVTADHPVNFQPCDGRTECRIPVLYAGQRDYSVVFIPCFGHDVEVLTLSVSYSDGTGRREVNRIVPLR